MFNNEVYGLTKGQYSPTSPRGQLSGSTPYGSIDAPFNPLSLALGADATFVARAIDTDRKHLTEVLRRAAEHKGTAFVEVLQNCNIYNDGAFDAVRDEKSNRIYLEHGAPIRFGEEGERGAVEARGRQRLRRAGRRGGRGRAARPRRARGGALARVRALATDAEGARRDSGRDLPRRRPARLRRADGRADRGRAGEGRRGDLAALVGSGDTWTIE